MNKLIIFFVLVTICAISTNVLAEGQYYDKVNKVHVSNDGHFLFNVVGNFSSIHGCSKPYYARSREPLTNPIAVAQMKVAMSAFLSQTKVYVSSTYGNCTPYGYVIFDAIQMEQ